MLSGPLLPFLAAVFCRWTGDGFVAPLDNMALGELKQHKMINGKIWRWVRNMHCTMFVSPRELKVCCHLTCRWGPGLLRLATYPDLNIYIPWILRQSSSNGVMYAASPISLTLHSLVFSVVWSSECGFHVNLSVTVITINFDFSLLPSDNDVQM